MSQVRKGPTIWTPSYYQYDALGSTRALTDESGDATDTYINDAWGNEVAVSGLTHNPFRWVGQVGYYHDDHLGTFYIRARVYDPLSGQWLSVDPIGFAARDTNVYRYVENGPLNRVDASGLVGGFVKVPPAIGKPLGGVTVTPPATLSLADANGHTWDVAAGGFYQWVGPSGFAVGGKAYLSQWDVNVTFFPNMKASGFCCKRIRLAAVTTHVTKALPSYIVNVGGTDWQPWGLPAINKVYKFDDIFNTYPPGYGIMDRYNPMPGQDSSVITKQDSSFWFDAWLHFEQSIRNSRVHSPPGKSLPTYSTKYVVAAYCVAANSASSRFFSFAVVNTVRKPVIGTGFYSLEFGLRPPTTTSHTFDVVYRTFIQNLSKGVHK